MNEPQCVFGVQPQAFVAIIGRIQFPASFKNAKMNTCNAKPAFCRRTA
jgi:hypothetical protein